MKSLLLASFLIFTASLAQASEIRITGIAAIELYEKLNIPEIGVHDEHGGQDFATAKYGKNIGCEKSLSDPTQVTCWFHN